MGENPRGPGHPSDFSPVRGAKEHSEQNVPRHHQTQGTLLSQQTKNIIIGAVVTILSSTIIYYLTIYQNRPGKSNANTYEVKEATIDAWESYTTFENIYTKNLLQIDSVTQDPALLLQEIRRESERFRADVADLRKKKNIDPDLIKALDRRLDNEENYMPRFERYISNILSIQKDSASQLRKIHMQAAAMSQWLTIYRSIYERAVNDIREIAKLLSDRYRYSFDMNRFELMIRTPVQIKEMDSLITIMENSTEDEQGNIVLGIPFSRNVQAASLEGNWENAENEVQLMPGGNMEWRVSNGGQAIGTWEISNDRLKIQAVIHPENKKVSWVFRLAYITSGSFVLANEQPPYEIYRMKRKS